MFRSAVERNLEIIGESLIRLDRVDPEICSQIDSYRKIIGLRKRLAHGYDTEIDHEKVWETIQNDLPQLRDQAAELLAQAE
jgi:uncharacterized protein with HEPN domain